MRAAKIDQDRLIIQQHVESSKHTMEMASMKKRNDELEELVQQYQSDSDALSGIKREQDKVAMVTSLRVLFCHTLTPLYVGTKQALETIDMQCILCVTPSNPLSTLSDTLMNTPLLHERYQQHVVSQNTHSPNSKPK